MHTTWQVHTYLLLGMKFVYYIMKQSNYSLAVHYIPHPCWPAMEASSEKQESEGKYDESSKYWLALGEY